MHDVAGAWWAAVHRAAWHAALRCAASLNQEADELLDAHARGYWQHQFEEDVQLTVMEPEGASIPSLLGTSLWTSRVGTEYRLTLLKSQVDQTLAYVGLVAVSGQREQGLSPEYWELSTAIGTRLLELGDAQAVQPA